MKRKIFLKSFTYNNKIYGTVVYDETDLEERQDFVWHMDEDNVPSEEVKKVIDYLAVNNLIDIDKIIKPIKDLTLDFIDDAKREKVWFNLFDIEVRMIDDGEETGRYFIHD